MKRLYNFIMTNDITKYIHHYKSSTPLILIKYPDELKTTVYLLDWQQRWGHDRSTLIDNIDKLDQIEDFNLVFSRDDVFCVSCL